MAYKQQGQQNEGISRHQAQDFKQAGHGTEQADQSTDVGQFQQQSLC